MKKVSLFLVLVMCVCSLGNVAYAEEVKETNETTKEIRVLSKKDIEEYYDDAVLVGDSIAKGFSTYARKDEKSVVHNMRFLVSGGYGALNALKPIDEESIHPEYNGKQQYVWDSIKQMKAKRVFISFGMNDLNPCRNRTAGKFKEVIDKIIEENPEIEVNVMSITLVLKDADVGRINNDFIRETNTELEKLCRENGWGFIDVTTGLQDEEGNLKEEYCSDGFVHLERKAYQDIYEEALYQFAKQKLLTADDVVWIDECPSESKKAK